MHHTGTKARLRSKHNLLAILVERVRDSNAYTRARVLQTWSHLAEASAVPLGHWVCVTELTVGKSTSYTAISILCGVGKTVSKYSFLMYSGNST